MFLQILEYNQYHSFFGLWGALGISRLCFNSPSHRKIEMAYNKFSFRNVTPRPYPSVDAVTIATFPFNLPLYAMLDNGRPMRNLFKTVLSIFI